VACGEREGGLIAGEDIEDDLAASAIACPSLDMPQQHLAHASAF
jgi:hypothetical protein